MAISSQNQTILEYLLLLFTWDGPNHTILSTEPNRNIPNNNVSNSHIAVTVTTAPTQNITSNIDEHKCYKPHNKERHNTLPSLAGPNNNVANCNPARILLPLINMHGVTITFAPTQQEQQKQKQKQQQKREPEHKPNKPASYQCPECGKQYKYKSFLAAHLTVHTDAAYVCEVCSRRFSRHHLYQQHKQTHYKINKNTKVIR